MSKKEVFLILSAISNRYARQNAEMEKHKKQSKEGTSGATPLSEMSDSEFKSQGFKVV